jgi:hypothetical protein
MGSHPQVQYKLPAWMKSKIFLGVLTLILWLASAVFSFYVMLEFQQMILRLYGTCCFDRWGFQILRQWSTIIFVGFWLAFVIISGEYHFQKIRTKASLRLFKWSYLVLVIILLIALIL